MMGLANTRITVMRGTEANDAGDLSDVGQPVYQHIPAALVESSKVTFDQATETRRTVRTSTCVVPSWADIDTDDTLMDETTGNYFAIESIEAQPSLGPPGDTILTLRTVTGVSAGGDG